MKQSFKKLISVIIALSMMMSLLVIPVNAATINLPKKVTLSSSMSLVSFDTTSTVKYTNSNSKIATISVNKSNGSFYNISATPLKAGTTTLTLKVGTKTYKCQITVPKKIATQVNLPKKYTTEPCSTYQTFLGTVVSSSSVTVTSSNKNIVSVAKSKSAYGTYSIFISPKKAGTATIYVKVGSKKYSCKVTVPKYVNPISSIKFNKTTISGSKFAKKPEYAMKYSLYANKKCPYSIKLKSGWKLVSVSYWQKGWGKSERLYGTDYVLNPDTGEVNQVLKNIKSVTVKGGEFEMTIIAKNTKTGIEQTITLKLK